jgi:C-terminal processing protease CtpA/Prc
MAQKLDWINDLPFEVLVRDTAIFMTDVFSPDMQRYADAEVISINGFPTKQLIVSAFKVISSDGYNTTYKAYKLQRNFNYFLNVILDSPDSLLLQTTAGNFTVRYPTSFIKVESDDPETHFSDLAGVQDAVLLTVPSFDDGKGAIRKCFKYMEEHHTAHLVVDLRDNGGGNGGIGAYLVSYVIDSAMTYYLDKKDNPLRYKDLMKRREGLLIANQYIMTDSLTRSYFFKIKPKRKYNFDGQVYVLTNGGTFSTGSYTASALKHTCDAMCFGIESGGSEYAIGGGVIRTLVLPYTGLAIRFPIYRWRFNVAPEDRGTGVVPDVEVDDFRGGILSEPDAGLQAVKAIIHSQISVPR